MTQQTSKYNYNSWEKTDKLDKIYNENIYDAIPEMAWLHQ